MKRWKKIKYKILSKSIGAVINSMYYVNPKWASKKAYHTFATPRKGLLKSTTDYLLTSSMKQIHFENYTIQTYQWQGNRETILLIHGWESNSHRWQALIEKLKEHNYNIISLDAPAQGHSSGRMFNTIDYSNFIHQVSRHFRPDYLIGHSLGGMAMYYYLYKFQPTDIKKVISLGAPNRFLRIAENYKKILSLTPKVYHTFLKEFYQRFQINVEKFNTETFLEKVNENIAIGIIHDTKDKIVPYSDAQQIVEKNPKISLLSTNNLGHSLHHDTVYQQIVYFLKNNTFKI